VDRHDGPGECESCGATDEALTLVRRLYVTPPSWDQQGSVREGDQEHWCFVCRTHYPHVLPGEPIPTFPDNPDR
jgi:hypothetical protein